MNENYMNRAIEKYREIDRLEELFFERYNYNY